MKESGIRSEKELDAKDSNAKREREREKGTKRSSFLENKKSKLERPKVLIRKKSGREKRKSQAARLGAALEEQNELFRLPGRARGDRSRVFNLGIQRSG